jgi:hypothetical protein
LDDVGRLIQTIQPNERSVDVSHLSSGLYFIRAVSDLGVAQHKVQIVH